MTRASYLESRVVAKTPVVVTEPVQSAPVRVLVHSIGLGGFYYSATAFEAPDVEAGDAVSGTRQVRWCAGATSKHRPAEEFQKPLVPWEPRQS